MGKAGLFRACHRMSADKSSVQPHFRGGQVDVCFDTADIGKEQSGETISFRTRRAEIFVATVHIKKCSACGKLRVIHGRTGCVDSLCLQGFLECRAGTRIGKDPAGWIGAF